MIYIISLYKKISYFYYVLFQSKFCFRINHHVHIWSKIKYLHTKIFVIYTGFININKYERR